MNQVSSPSKLTTKHMIIVAAVGTALLGVFLASRINVAPTTEEARMPASDTQVLVNKIDFGTISGTNTGMLPANTPITQQRGNAYKTTDRFGMKVTTASEVREPIGLNVRLLTINQQVIPLNPESVTFTPGESVFCCWQIQETGAFTLQVFRPEGTITSIPIIIESAL